MVDVARQSVEALRRGLTAPAQAAAANLVDQLVRGAFTTVLDDRSYRYSSTRRRVDEYSQLIGRVGVTFLGTLRELATMMPVFNALEPWRPEDGTPPPTTFNRHVTTHYIASPDQVSSVNALIAVMLAVSLLSQRHDSGWSSLATLRHLDAHVGTLNASR